MYATHEARNSELRKNSQSTMGVTGIAYAAFVIRVGSGCSTDNRSHEPNLPTRLASCQDLDWPFIRTLVRYIGSYASSYEPGMLSPLPSSKADDRPVVCKSFVPQTDYGGWYRRSERLRLLLSDNNASHMYVNVWRWLSLHMHTFLPSSGLPALAYTLVHFPFVSSLNKSR